MKAKMTPIERQLSNGCIDMIDRADPTRSRESKPSDRMFEAYAFRRTVISVAKSIALAAGLALAVMWFLM